MNNLYDVLEACLQEIDQGADVDAVLLRYPEYAEELRPILDASGQAKLLAAAGPSPEVLRRNRSKVLQQAGQMREAKTHPSRRVWSVPLRRALVSLAVIALLFVSSTRLVRAASTTLPGDNLYPVKRTWEDVLVLFTFNVQARAALEVEHENERLTELNELFAEGRSAKVEFAGTVTSQNANQWLVGKIPVLVSAQTEFDGQAAQVGDAVRVKGYSQPDGSVLAKKVELLPAGIPLPTIDDNHDSGDEQEESGTQSQATQVSDGHSGDGADEQTSEIEETESHDGNATPGQFSLEGVVDSLNGTDLSVNGQSLDISAAEIQGTPKAGVEAKIEGYYDPSGVFIVTRIEFKNSSVDSGENSQSDGNKDGGDHQNDSSSDNGGGDNSGSGGGSDD